MQDIEFDSIDNFIEVLIYTAQVEVFGNTGVAETCHRKSLRDVYMADVGVMHNAGGDGIIYAEDSSWPAVAFAEHFCHGFYAPFACRLIKFYQFRSDFESVFGKSIEISVETVSAA